MIFASLLTLQIQMSDAGAVQVIQGSTVQLSCVDVIQQQQDSIDDDDPLQVILFYRGDVLLKPGRYMLIISWYNAEKQLQ